MGRARRSCHGETRRGLAGAPKVALVGSPNVGKSAVFNRLTGAYVAVSNYPGTTVEVSRGRARFGGVACEVIDTPGIYSLLPLTEDERVTRRLLLGERPEVVVHVVDAKNLSRMFPLTLELLEAGLPVVLALNMMDEAAAAGLSVDTHRLEAELGVRVVETVAAAGRGMDELREAVAARLRAAAGRTPSSRTPSSRTAPGRTAAGRTPEGADRGAEERAAGSCSS